MDFFKKCAVESKKIATSKEYSRFRARYDEHNHIIILGNGGSQAAASHISQDYVKRGGKKAQTFSDPSMLTCFINDYGMEMAYVEYLKAYATDETLVILISSSGESPNIINCIKYCHDHEIAYGILTAFRPDNTCRVLARSAGFEFYVDTESYGVAECVHQIFLHGAVE